MTDSIESLRSQAKAALAKKKSGYSSRMKREWLAEKMGIEERYAIIADMDATECRTVINICNGGKI